VERGIMGRACRRLAAGLAVMAVVGAVLGTGGAVAQSNAGPYPSKPVRLVLPVPPGGLQDSLARAVANELSKAWGQTVVVENRAGASGIIAADAVAKSAPDGYTIFMTDNVTLMTNQFLRKSLPYDPVRDFAPVIALVQAGNVMVTSPQSSARSVQELIALARAKPGELNYGSFGLGSSPHVDTEALAAAAGIKLTHIPYKGGPEILQGLLGGQIAFSITGLPPALPLIRQGRMRALAYGGLRRSPAMPEVPTLAESGLPGFESGAWFGWLIPSATPRAVIDRIAADAGRVIATPEFRDKYIAGVGLEVLNLAPAAAAELLAADREKYASRLKSLNMSLD
jgi:tripartite-type tricarboxylate transporter receptor subunit TctC